MVTRSTFNRLQRSISELANVVAPLRIVPYKRLFGTQGEDVEKLAAKYRGEHPGETGPFVARLIVWESLPRREFCSAQSIAAEIPRVRAQIERVLTAPDHPPSTYEHMRSTQNEWKRLAEQFGVDYGPDVNDARWELRKRIRGMPGEP